jgi:hypothetical protein
MSNIATLDQLCDCGIQISGSTQDRPTDWFGQQASIVFGKSVITCISFLRLIPQSSFYATTKNLHLWDLSSAASLCRNLIESYYVQFYVSSFLASEEERLFRRALWEYHCAFERHEMLRSGLPKSKRLPDVAASLAKHRLTLEQTTQFQGLSAGHQKKLLAGSKFKLDSSIELSRAAGISEYYYSAQYKYCSAFAHSAPFSISQMDAFRAGTPEAARVLGVLVSLATGYSALAVRDFIRLFPDQEISVPPDIKECIAEWEEIFKWKKQPWFDASDES